MSHLLDLSECCPFFTYRTFDASGNLVGAQLVPSLLHHYESEKFRGVDDELRQEALLIPAARELRKFTKKRVKRWRADWRSVRGDVLRSGMAMQALHTDTGKRKLLAAFNQAMELSAQRSVNGLPGAFVAAELQKLMLTSKNRQSERLSAVVLNGCAPEDICSRMDALYGNGKPISATLYAGLDADPVLEMWCAARAIPVRLVGTDARRFRETDAPGFVQDTSTLVACLPENRAATLALRTLAKKRRAGFRFLEFKPPQTQEALPAPQNSFLG